MTDNKYIYLGVILAMVILILAFTWKVYPNAKFVVLSRSDGENKYIAIQNIDIIDSSGREHDIVGIEGKGILTSGFSNSTYAANATGPTAPLPGISGDILLNGKNMAYVKDRGSVVGPTIGFLPSDNALNGYLIFILGCATRISKINIKSSDDDTSRKNLQGVKIYLLNNDRNLIEHTDQIIPSGSGISQNIHHVNFV